jgi:predicted metal-dependent enzyme (double-stranded beta helix superfamily)
MEKTKESQMDRLEIFCGQFRKMLTEEKTVFHSIERGRELVAELTSRPDWFYNYLEKMICAGPHAESERSGIWPNEYTVYRSPDKLFVVFAYIWEVSQKDFVHDHNAWGIVGTLFGKMGEKKYERLDDGTREAFCEIRETENCVIGPGETTFVLPLNKGLHAMDNSEGEIAVSVNVYRKVIDRNYIQSFDPVGKTVTRVYPPRTLKEVLAVKTMAAIDPLRTEEVLQNALGASHPPHLKKEYEAVLRNLRGEPA